MAKKPDPNLPSILQRINEVRKVVKYVKKEDDKVQGQYKAVSHDAVTRVLNEHLVAQGIIVMPHVVQSETKVTHKHTGNGTPIIRYEARFQVHFVNVDDKSDSIVLVLDSHAEDTGDKSPGKALSYAIKYAKLKMFDLETGEDDESRIESKPQTLTPENHQTLIDVCNDAGLVPEDTLEALATKVYKVKNIMEINNQWATDAMKRLKSKVLSEKKPEVKNDE